MSVALNCVCFFFSSRRRHTRSVSAFLLNRSSDLRVRNIRALNGRFYTVGMGDAGIKSAIQGSNVPNPDEAVPSFVRSEERRVGKECRSRWGPNSQKKEQNRRNN